MVLIIPYDPCIASSNSFFLSMRFRPIYTPVTALRFMRLFKRAASCVHVIFRRPFSPAFSDYVAIMQVNLVISFT